MEPISSFLQGPLFSKLSFAVATLSLLAFFWWRTGSIASILEHLWRLATGKSEVRDPRLKKFIQETKDLEKFRFIYRVKVESIIDLHRLFDWMSQNSIGIADIRRSGRWIDLKSDTIITAPPLRYFVMKGLVAVLCYFTMYALSLGASSSFAFLQMNESKAWFLSDTKTIKTIGWNSKPVSPSECTSHAEQVKNDFHFSEPEVALICQALTTQDKSFTSLVAKAVDFQRWALFIGAAVFFLGLALALIRMASAGTAKKLYKRIAAPKKQEDEPGSSTKPGNTFRQRRRVRPQSSDEVMLTEPGNS